MRFRYIGTEEMIYQGPPARVLGFGDIVKALTNPNPRYFEPLEANPELDGQNPPSAGETHDHGSTGVDESYAWTVTRATSDSRSQFRPPKRHSHNGIYHQT